MDIRHLEMVTTHLVNRGIRVERCLTKEQILCPTCKEMIKDIQVDCVEWLAEYERLEKEGKYE
jgi:hypothetical protein